MKIFIKILVSAFLLSTCSNSSNENSNVKPETEIIITVPVGPKENVPVLSIEEQLKTSLLAAYYERGVVSVKEDVLHFAFKFDLNSDGGDAPDTYGSNLTFSFKVGETLTFPENIEFVEDEFSEEDSALWQHYKGRFNLVAATEEVLIYNSSAPQRTLVLFKDGEKTGTLAYYFHGGENPGITAPNIHEVLENTYKEGEMVIEHSISSGLRVEIE
jgi:hypothetical protein